MRSTLALTLAALLLAGAVAACSGGKSDAPTLSPEQRTTLYKNAIESARDQEMNEAIPVLTAETDPLADTILPMLGITAENSSSFAAAVSAMNVRAYAIAAVMPAAGKDEEVLTGLNAFIDNQKQSFQFYLEDQYEIARNARLETLEDGTLLLVMGENQDQLFDAVRDEIEKAG